jgi:hypothetical protein
MDCKRLFLKLAHEMHSANYSNLANLKASGFMAFSSKPGTSIYPAILPVMYVHTGSIFLTYQYQ